jgi:hypothetical protein
MDRPPDMTVAPCAADAEATKSHALPRERTKLMAKVTQSRPPRRSTARHTGDTTLDVSPRLMEDAVRVFLALGITAADLRLRARPGSVLVDLADAMDSPAGAS